MTDERDTAYEDSHEQHGHLSLDDRDPGLPDWPDAGADPSDLRSHLEPGDQPDIRWDTDDDGLVADVLGEEDDSGTSGLAAKLSHAAHSAPAVARRRGRLEALATINEEDFEEGPERDSFKIIQANKAALFGSKQANLLAALEFFFGRDFGREVGFDLCCDVLGARADVIRLRIQYEWFLRNSMFTAPFPFEAKNLPRLLQGPVQYHGGTIGDAAARECWVQPGIEHSQLVAIVCELEKCTTKECETSLARLNEEMLLSHELGWYVTGRNPLRYRMDIERERGWRRSMGASMHWSALFGRDA